jgi:hypothetical protein
MKILIRLLTNIILIIFFTSCQIPPTKILESDANLEQRSHSKIEYGEKFDLKNSVIMDVRSRFDFEMAKLPRSFNAYWKDWDLRDYKNIHRQEKIIELQRLLSLKGIDPLTKVIILGKGLKGRGEEFLVASTLIVLGVTKINFINEKQVKEAVLAKKLSPLENLPAWQKNTEFKLECEKLGSPDIAISMNKVGQYTVDSLFDESLKTKEQVFPKSLNLKIESKDSFWAYGLALYFIEQGRKVCVL